MREERGRGRRHHGRNLVRGPVPAGQVVSVQDVLQWTARMRGGGARSVQPYGGATAEMVATGFQLGTLAGPNPFLWAPDNTPCWLRVLATVALDHVVIQNGITWLEAVITDMANEHGQILEWLDLSAMLALLAGSGVAFSLRVYYTRYGPIESIEVARSRADPLVNVAFVLNLQSGSGHYFVYDRCLPNGQPMPDRFRPEAGEEEGEDVVERLAALRQAAQHANPWEHMPRTPSPGPQPQEAADRPRVLVTRQYAHDFPQYHQCLCPGGEASSDALQVYPGPTCMCQFGVWQGHPCPHVLRALRDGVEVLVLGWEINWALPLVSLFQNVWIMNPRDSRPVARKDKLFLAYGTHVDGLEPEVVAPFPLPKVACLGGQVALGRQPLPKGATAWRWMLQPQSRASLWFRLVARHIGRQLGAGLGMFAGLQAPSALPMLTRHVFAGIVPSAMRALAALCVEVLPARVGESWHAALCTGAKVVDAAANYLLTRPSRLGPMVPVRFPRIGDMLRPWGVPKVRPTQVTVERMGWWASTMSYAFAAGCAGYLGYRLARYLTYRPVQLVPDFVSDRPVPESLIHTGNAKVDAAVRSRAVTRQILGTDLMQPLLTSVAAKEGYPDLSQEGVELATAVLQRSPPMVGAAQEVKGVCWCCGGRLGKKAKLHLCDGCHRALPGQGSRYVWDHRAQTIVELGLPVNQAVPMLPVYSEYVPPPVVEQRAGWEEVKTNFKPDEAEMYREQNRIQRGVLLGVGHPGHWPGVAQRGPESIYNGLKTRTFRKVIEGSSEPYENIEHFIDDMLPTLRYGSIHPMPLEQWFREQQRELDMRKAYAEYRESGLTEEELYCTPFIKSEWFYSARAVGEGQDWSVSFKPRPIYCLPDKTQVLVGPHTRPLMHYFQEVMGPGQVLQYCGCNTPAQNQAVLDEISRRVEAGEVVWMNDFTCFETSHNAASMNLLLNLYKRVWAETHHEERDRVLAAWQQSHFKSRSCGITFSGPLPLMMLSGRSDTAIMNSLFNALVTACAHVLARLELGWSELPALDHQSFRDVLGKYVMYFVGDDSTVVGPPAAEGYSRRLEALYVEAGLNSKIEETSDLAKVVFLGHRPYNMRQGKGRRWVWGPTLGRRMYKHHFALDVTGDPRSWIQTVAGMETKLFGPLPILGTMARRVSELVGRPRKLNKHEAKKFAEKEKYTMAAEVAHGCTADCATFEALARAYDLSPEALMDLDRQCAKVPRVPYLLSHPALDVIMRVDN